MTRWFHQISHRKIALQMLAILVLLAQTLAMTHKVVHAGQFAPQSASVKMAGEGNVWSDLFGHDAGAACDEWNASFALDANPDAGHVDISAVQADDTVVVAPVQTAVSAPRTGLFLARAPPRV